MNQLIVVRLAKAGTFVKQGDLLVEFDRQAQHQTRAIARPSTAISSSRSTRSAASSSRRARMRDAQLKQAENDAQDRGARRPRQRARRHDHRREEPADARRGAGEASRSCGRPSTCGGGRSRRHPRILEIQRERAMNAWKHAESNAERMRIVSPHRRPGRAQVASGRTARWAKCRKARKCVPAFRILDVVDPSAMRVRVNANQADVEGLRVGSAGAHHARLVSRRGPSPAGSSQLSPIATTSTMSNRVRTFVAMFTIEGTRRASAAGPRRGHRGHSRRAPRDDSATSGRQGCAGALSARSSPVIVDRSLSLSARDRRMRAVVTRQLDVAAHGARDEERRSSTSCSSAAKSGRFDPSCSPRHRPAPTCRSCELAANGANVAAGDVVIHSIRPCSSARSNSKQSELKQAESEIDAGRGRTAPARRRRSRAELDAGDDRRRARAGSTSGGTELRVARRRREARHRCLQRRSSTSGELEQESRGRADRGAGRRRDRAAEARQGAVRRRRHRAHHRLAARSARRPPDRFRSCPTSAPAAR